MSDDSRALFTDSNAIFASTFTLKGEEDHLFPNNRMNFDMNNIQDCTNNNKSVDSNGIGLNSQLLSHYPPHNSSLVTQMRALDNSSTYRMRSSVEMDNQVSNLLRKSSSPAGFFSHLATPQSGYSVGNYRLGNGSNGDLGPTASRFKSQMSLSSGIPSSLGMLSRISETDGGNTGNHDAKNGSVQYYTSDYPWNDSLHFAENYTGLKRKLDENDRLFSSNQNGEIPRRPSFLSHHLSLPKISNDMSCMNKLLQYQDSVPCKIRAKRGCATHPRSIAERVRRTRISERMRKLQELVPRMDKQTNTADMLDLAVEYIKDLQTQYKTLSDNRANCKCYGMQKQCLN